MTKKPRICVITFLIVLIYLSTAIAGDKVQIPVSGDIFKEYAELEEVTNSLKKSSTIKLDCFYKVIVKDGDELLIIEKGKTTLKITEGNG